MKQEELDKLLQDKLEGLNFEYNPAHWEMLQDRMQIEGMDADDPSAFDATMKGKLENISPEFNALHWAMMQESIDAEGLSVDVDPIDEFVDDIVRTRLENITPELNPIHWEMMKDAMNAEGMETEVDPVDEVLKGKLENIEYAYNPVHWDAMQDRIDEEAYADAQQVDDVLFDATTYGHLSNVEIPYNEEHWELMKERIDAEFSIRGKMMRYKVAEVALILLIIITAFHYLPLHKKKMKAKAIANAAVIENAKINVNDQQAAIASVKITPTKEILNTSNNTIVSNSIAKDNTTSLTTNESVVATTETESTIVATDELFTNNELAVVPNTIAFQEPTVIAPSSTFTDTPIERTEDTYANDFASALSASIISKSEAPISIGNAIATSTMTQVEAVETLQAGLLDIDENETAVVSCSSCTKLTEKWSFSLGMFSSFDYNYVMTPYDNVFQAGAYAQDAYGYGGGLSFGFRYNKWEVETGAIYSFKQYAPKPRIEIFSGNLNTGYLGESINDVELNMVQIPLNLKYHFYQKGKWNIYANGGATVNLAMQANYDKKQYYFGSLSSLPTSLNASNSEIAISETTSKKRFADGILQGGNLIENRYFTANLGLGVERKFNPRWSIFGQPTYQHQLLSQGLGPNQDRINTLSILTGTRVTF